MITRFMLNNIASRVIPGKIPPYWAFYERTTDGDVSGYESFMDRAAGNEDVSGYELEQMSDGQVAELIKNNVLGIPMKFPLGLKTDDGEWWTLPFEPLITVNGKNIIIKKQINKGQIRGTVKERWTQDDYTVSISGILMNVDSDSYPAGDVQKLRAMCETAKLQVSCPLLEIFSISRIVVENFSFPFTSGIRNQAYSIDALSDDIYRLLLKKEDLKQQ